MARQIQIEYDGAAYHVMARGNQGQAIFAGDLDRKVWLETLAETCEKTGWRIHAHVMMGKSLSPVGRDAGGEPGGGDEVVTRHLHPALQFAAFGFWTFVSRALQGVGGGWCGGQLFWSG